MSSIKNKLQRFVLHWLGGTTEIVEGFDIADAFSRAGYSAGALAALDYYEIQKDN